MDLTLQLRLIIAGPIAKADVLRTCENKQGAHSSEGKSFMEKCCLEDVV